MQTLIQVLRCRPPSRNVPTITCLILRCRLWGEAWWGACERPFVDVFTKYLGRSCATLYVCKILNKSVMCPARNFVFKFAVCRSDNIYVRLSVGPTGSLLLKADHISCLSKKCSWIHLLFPFSMKQMWSEGCSVKKTDSTILDSYAQLHLAGHFDFDKASWKMGKALLDSSACCLF